MVLTSAKLALLTSFALMADAKYGFRRTVDETDETVNGSDDEIVADSWDAQADSRRPDIEILRGLRKDRKKSKKSKKKDEKDFARGVLEAIFEALPTADGPEQMIKLGEVVSMFDVIVGDNFDSDGNKAFDRGFAFGDKRLYGGVEGCREECRDAPFLASCQECCISFEHTVDWNCDGADENVPVAKCCTEWTAECYTTDSANNNNHACKDCGYGYGGYGRGYGGYGGYGYGGYRGRRRSETSGAEGEERRRNGYGYGRGYGYRGYGGYGRRYGYGR